MLLNSCYVSSKGNTFVNKRKKLIQIKAHIYCSLVKYIIVTSSVFEVSIIMLCGVTSGDFMFN
jgi:hypothetical protein